MAGSGLKMRIKVENFRETAKLLDTEVLAVPAWPNAMEEIADLAGDAITAGAPIRSGRTINRVVKKVQRKPIPKWAVGATKAVSRSPAYPQGYPYPRLTAFSPYAQSRYRKGVNPHRGWFAQAVKRVEGAMENILQRAADAIARKWESG